jgi:predicted RecB family nuclease
MATKITRDVLESYLNCRYKGHLKLAGERGTPSDYETMTTAARQASREEALAKLVARFGEGDSCRGVSVTSARLKQGTPLLADATLEDDGMSLRLDALKRASGASKVGDHHYVPVLHNHGDKVGWREKLLLAVHGLALVRIQGLRPASGFIVRGPDARLGMVRLDAKLYRQAEQVLADVTRLQAGSEPPRLMLNGHCQHCEFRQRCRAAGVEKDDLSLLRGLSSKEVAALNAKGIFTVTQYSYTFRPHRMKRVSAKKHDHSLQALAIRENTVYVAKKPELPNSKAVLYLDVEGLPEEGSYYLIGLTVVEGESRRHLSFWADAEAAEASIWASFLAAVGAIEDFVLLHYGSYESKFLDRMEARHGGDPGLIAKLKSRSTNVLSLIYSRVYFPVHANDLKSVAGCLGFRWSAPDAAGLQSVVWRHTWQATGDDSLKRTLLTYNQEDCEALGRVVDLLRSLGGDQGRQGDDNVPRIAGMEGIVGQHGRKFGAQKFALPEFATITKCSYFDYQRDKILCRTTPTVKVIGRRRKRPKRQTLRANREVECGVPSACPHCGLDDFGVSGGYQKLVIDLKSFRGGIKRWVTKYKAKRYRCRRCRSSLYPEDYVTATAEKHGRGLCNWVAYATIALRQTNDAIAESLDDLFGIAPSQGSICKLRRQAAEYYRPTYESLLSALRNGPFVHGDETKARVKDRDGDGYAWVFANPETVAYVYAPTREGDTVQQTLAGFKGVLVSDFYSAYDSLDCPQQKCLIHLIRDFNDDLLRHPFDGELKQQAARFAVLLQTVVATIDRYGLKKCHLNKHRKDVDRFYAAETPADYESELARHYQQRLLKYKDKLFTFLEHDGIPWNNNNGEHAVKAFATRRKLMGRAFVEAGIRDYLLLLSIYQTLRYRNLSFWQFLQSGETDIEAFCRRGRRKVRPACLDVLPGSLPQTGGK